MIDGKYHALAINDKFPQIGFTETAHVTSTTLDKEACELIIAEVKKANESLGLQWCSTHTEVKLMKNREVGVIETAARFAGWNMIPNIKKAHGVDAAIILCDLLCDGESSSLPQTMLRTPSIYYADFHLYPTDFISNSSLDSNINTFNVENISIPNDALIGNVRINSFSTASPAHKVDTSIFESFNAIAYIELCGESSIDIIESIKNIKIKATINISQEG